MFNKLERVFNSKAPLEKTRKIEISNTPKPISPLNYPQYSKIMDAYVNGYCISQIIYVLCSLKIPDIIGSEELTIDDICNRLCLTVNKQALFRLLTASKTYDIVDITKQHGNLIFKLTDMGAILQTGTSDNRKVLHYVQPDIWDAWSFLEMYIREEIETPPFDYVTKSGGSDIVDLFLDYMKTVESTIDINCFATYIKEDSKVIQCGASGIIIDKLFENYPSIKPKFISKTGENANIPIITCLEECNTFICIGVLSQHEDHSAFEMIEKCFDMVDTLLIIDIILEPTEYVDNTNKNAHISDILKMLYGGKERTLENWKSLLDDKFMIETISPLPHDLSMIVCHKIIPIYV